jgi:hypothetical protein
MSINTNLQSIPKHTQEQPPATTLIFVLYPLELSKSFKALVWEDACPPKATSIAPYGHWWNVTLITFLLLVNLPSFSFSAHSHGM